MVEYLELGRSRCKLFFLLKYKIMHFVSNSETVILYIDFTEYSGYHAPAENCRPQIMTQS